MLNPAVQMATAVTTILVYPRWNLNFMLFLVISFTLLIIKFIQNELFGFMSEICNIYVLKLQIILQGKQDEICKIIVKFQCLVSRPTVLKPFCCFIFNNIKFGVKVSQLSLNKGWRRGRVQTWFALGLDRLLDSALES